MVLLSLNISTMTEFQQEPHSPERGEKRTGIFSLDRLSPDEIAQLGEGVALIKARYEPDMDEITADVRRLYVNDFEVLARDNPGKAEDVLALLRDEGENSSLTMAAMVSPSIAQVNYELARDSLISIVQREDLPYASETAEMVIKDLLETLPEEQAVDLESHVNSVT